MATTTEFKAYYSSDIGLIEITSSPEAIQSLYFIEAGAVPEPISQATEPKILNACLTQLDEYFRGRRDSFELPLEPEGTPFQKAVWQQLLRIPFGQTASYLDIARMVGNAKAVRAVGAANGQNPISVIIPCHRVIGSNGKLTGYGGGLWRKAWLLQHEGVLSTQLALL
ncbi:MAG: methylated-DNA--[protein]-cysteine S-methyltransferase [Anaerolineae bacterium]|nr:methylated-DNA--[protein]-cysteine S-methyltransferase [Anaerolineae bacterium]